MTKYKLSLSPIKIGEILLQNKIVCSPVGVNMSETDGTITDKEIDYFENLSKNNLGMIIVGNATVSNMGKGTLNEIVIGKPFHLPQLKKLASTIKKNGTVACIQIAHKGAQGNSKYTGERVVGPSKYIVPDIGIEAEVLTIDEIKEIEQEYANAIIQADEAGFDFIEIMAAHGYLMHEFFYYIEY